ncbi:MAG: hypothetical protein K9L26_01290, partial [Candidatus Izimaplasma sp.]|nr:hypothetical protein [Candidatus Izimaplasma bacterium]
WAIYQMASKIINYDPKFAAYFHKKTVKQNKHYCLALGHVSKKVLRVLYSILKYRLVYTAQ